MHRHYGNTDKSHAFEHETAIEVLALTGVEGDRKVAMKCAEPARRVSKATTWATVGSGCRGAGRISPRAGTPDRCLT